MKQVFARPAALKDKEFHYCPGCGHSLVHRLLAEVIDQLGIARRIVGVPPTGCALLAPEYFYVDMGEAPRGRGLSVASGLKRALRDHLVFAYQGDGDLAALGAGEALHTANRGEPITVIYVNNGLYALSGGQMAPSTVAGMASATTPGGRDLARDGAPLDVTSALAGAAGSVYLERVCLATPEMIQDAKRALAKAFQVQMHGLGFSLVEVLSPCPTYLKMPPSEAMAWTAREMSQSFPLGVIKDTSGLDEDRP
jgi:2-oxoglutarate/2-oxoacid ferredoxin oxidoreductase subunit beta